jgi:hypothetical protein
MGVSQTKKLKGVMYHIHRVERAHLDKKRPSDNFKYNKLTKQIIATTCRARTVFIILHLVGNYKDHVTLD